MEFTDLDLENNPYIQGSNSNCGTHAVSYSGITPIYREATMKIVDYYQQTSENNPYIQGSNLTILKICSYKSE